MLIKLWCAFYARNTDFGQKEKTAPAVAANFSRRKDLITHYQRYFYKKEGYCGQ
ncbi:hypothetical protein J2X14_000747 [Pantoea alhagi]|uniref:hypothetical protein n=1 Tax=Mixta sp. BE291 TaxID=3158787 RepID=UPI002860B24E|nr:hypothetical protein [Pantoea alhagi]